MRASRLLVTAGAGLALALAAIPSALASAPSGTWDPPDDGAYVAELPLTGSASDPDATTDGSGGGIVSVTYDLRPEQTEEPGDDCTATLDEGERQQTFDEPRPSIELSLPATIPCNRRYVARATITTRPVGPPSDLQPETAVIERRISVAVPPVTPDDVTAAHVPADDKSTGASTSTSTTAGGAAAADADLGHVQVRWDANPEADLVGYVIHRSAPGAGGYEVVDEVDASETTWTDDDLDYGGSYGYRVDALRRGPDWVDEDGEVTTVASVRPAGVLVDVPGPPPPETTTTTTPTTAPPAASSNGVGLPQPHQPSSPPTTADTGFDDEIDYGQEGQVAEPGAGEDQVAPEPVGGDAAVVATFDDGSDEDRKAVMAPIAGGLALLVGALQLRFLARRASEPA